MNTELYLSLFEIARLVFIIFNAIYSIRAFSRSIVKFNVSVEYNKYIYRNIIISTKFNKLNILINKKI